MNKVFFKGKEIELIGNVIEQNKQLNFEAYDHHGNLFNTSQLFGKKSVISIFPKINTSVCDFQTKKIVEYSKNFPEINFISISMDPIETFQNWCMVNNVKGITILSDSEKKEFAYQTNLLMKDNLLLARGLIILDEENNIEKIMICKEVTDEVDWSALDNWIKSL